MALETTYNTDEDTEKKRLAAMTKDDLAVENKLLRLRLNDMETKFQKILDSKAKLFNDCCLAKSYQKSKD